MNERLKEIKEKFYKECTNASYSPIVNFHVLDIMGLIEIAEQQQEEIERYKKALLNIYNIDTMFLNFDGTEREYDYKEAHNEMLKQADKVLKPYFEKIHKQALQGESNG